MSATHAYIGVAPCGCVFSACVDNPEHAKETAKFCRDVIKDGEHIERVTIEEARERLKGRHHGPQCRQELALQEELPL